MQSITIALASDFVPHMVYKYGYGAHSLEGYINFTLTTFHTSDWGNKTDEDWPGPNVCKDNDTCWDGGFPDTCYFKGYRADEGPDYKIDETWYHIFAAKLAFVLVFEHFVLGLTGLLAVLVPDMPTTVKRQIQRENLLARELLFDSQARNEADMDPRGRARLSTAEITDEDELEADGGGDGGHFRRRPQHTHSTTASADSRFRSNLRV